MNQAKNKNQYMHVKYTSKQKSCQHKKYYYLKSKPESSSSIKAVINNNWNSFYYELEFCVLN